MQVKANLWGTAAACTIVYSKFFGRQVIFCQTPVGTRLIFSMLLLGANLIFANLPPGADLFFEPGKRRDSSRTFMPVTKKVLEINKKCNKQTCRELNSLKVG